jgi:zinc/manganese transport system substrate-binding protein
MNWNGCQRIAFLLLIVLFSSIYNVRANALINIVAAENTYGEVAKELGGPYVSVVSILNNPNQDPHLFSTTPDTAKAISRADILIYNGADYDPWMTVLLKIEGQNTRHVINVADFVHAKSGDNPHIWYMPETIPLFASAFTTQLITLDPQHQQYYAKRLKQFNDNYQAITKKISELKQRFQNTPVIATEPVFGYMAVALALQMHGYPFQVNMMNDVPPTVSQIKSFEDDLSNHKVSLLIYNNQVINPLTERMRDIAHEKHIPVLGVSEMIPPGLTYIQWIMKELDELQTALANKNRN